MLFLPSLYLDREQTRPKLLLFYGQQAGGSGSKQMIQSWLSKVNAVNKGPISFHFYCICIPFASSWI